MILYTGLILAISVLSFKPNFICLVSAPDVAPTNLSAGAIVGIVLACLFVLGVGVFYLL